MKTYNKLYFLLLVINLFNIVSSGIPTKEEQTNLLKDVQEVFEQLQLLVSVEVNSTDESVVSDINKMVQRAKDKLDLLEELSLTKMSCTSNAICTSDYKEKFHDLNDKSCEELKTCLKQCTESIKINSFNLKNNTDCAIQCGENLLDTLYNCSRKTGFQVISCYKDVISKDVAPVKKLLLGAIAAHIQGHLKTVEIRNIANKCVDDVLEKYQIKIMSALYEALHCS